MLWLALVCALIAAGAYASRDQVAPAGTGLRPALQQAAPASGRSGQLATTNASGRRGAYYVPLSSKAGMPVLVALHGTGGDGSSMVREFQALADARGFAIVAPDSRISPDGHKTWQVGDKAGEVTPDLTHVVACLAEARALLEIPTLGDDVLAAGFSGGASSAPYVATNVDGFSAYAVLHGGVFAGGLGRRMVRGWFSTGASDPMRPPQLVRGALESLQPLGLPPAVYREFPGAHVLSTTEKEALISWWLDRRE